MKTTITEQGLALINSVVADSAQLTFTKMEIGDGVNINTSSIVTNLVNKRLEVSISEVYASEDGSVVCANVENSGVEESFEIREIGVFAKKAGSNSEPILFAYVECEGVGGIPASNIVSVNNEIRVTIITDQADVVYIDNTQDVSHLTEQVDNLSKSVEGSKSKVNQLERDLENYCRKTDVASGLRTQTIIGCDPVNGGETGIDLYLSGDTATVRVKTELVSFPKKSGTIALLSDVEDTIGNDPHANLVKWQAYANTLMSETGFAQKYVSAMDQYLEDTTATTEWMTSSTTSSTNPYYLQNPSIPIVDFTVRTASSASSNVSSFHADINVAIFLPNASKCDNMLLNCFKFNKPLSLPSATTCCRMLFKGVAFTSPLNVPNAVDCSYMLFDASIFNQPLYLPKATNCSNMLNGASKFNHPLSLPKAQNCSSMLRNAKAFNSTLDLPEATNCANLLHGSTVFNLQLTLPKATNCDYLLNSASTFNQVVNLPSCSSAAYAFSNTAMSAENISATLDSLPEWTDGGSHVITFSGSTGASSLTQSSPSVAAAVAKGWTVKL